MLSIYKEDLGKPSNILFRTNQFSVEHCSLLAIKSRIESQMLTATGKG